ASQSLAELMARVQQEQSRLSDHQYLGLTDIQGLVGEGELFDTLYVFENYPVAADITGTSGDLRVTSVEGRDAAHYPVSLAVLPGQTLRLQLGHDTGLFDEATAQRMVERLRRVIEEMVAGPEARIGGVDVLEPAERERLLVEYNDTTRPVPDGTLPQLFEAQVARTPDAVAVAYGDTSVSYGELNARANRLARVLVKRGVGPERLVGLALPRSVDMVVAVLAVLKAGGAYLPIDPDYPGERIAFMLQDADPVCVLTVAETDHAVAEAGVPCSRIEDLYNAAEAGFVASDDLAGRERLGCLRTNSPAYVIYTSGSTGRPKGVSVTHSGLASMGAMHADRFGVGPDSRVLQFASPSFDASVWELVMALLSGAALVVADRDRLLPGQALAELVAAAG
ncbi:AMP-binding protein, partial [Streptomyces chartreusis]|uniref:AMP-binding protein n=1 Tax=Streptomyces chartreusis TaxID=1969 RepID=UPI0033A8BED3